MSVVLRTISNSWACHIPSGSHRKLWDNNSKAIHRTYACRAQMELPPLSEFEQMRTKFSEMSKTVQPVMASAYLHQLPHLSYHPLQVRFLRPEAGDAGSHNRSIIAKPDF